MRQVARYIKYLQICTHRTVYSYIIINTHDDISVRCVCKHVLGARSYSWVSTSRCEKMRSKQETSCCAD